MKNNSTLDLIYYVRSLINDNDQVFSDETINHYLDQSRTFQNKLELTLLSNTMFQSNVKYWDDAIILSNGTQTITPKDKQLLSGYFWLTEPENQLYATGFTYDVYFTAYELLTIWAGKIEDDIIKFSSDGSSYEFAGSVKSKLSLAEIYRKKSLQAGSIGHGKLVRNDTTR